MSDTLENRGIWFRFGRKAVDIPTLCFALVLSLGPVMTLVPNEYLYLLLFYIRLLVYGLVLVNIVITRQRNVLFFGAILITVWIMATIWLYPMNKPALLEIAPDMFMQIFYFTLGNSCVNDKSIIKTCTVFAYFEFVFLTLFVFSTTGRLFMENSRDGYATISNGFFWIALFFTFASKKIKAYRISAIAAFLMMLIYGRRSHVLYYAVTLCIYAFRKMVRDEKVTAQKIIIRIFILCVVVTVALFYRQILILISTFITSFGFNSRTVSMMLGGEFGNLNGRDALYELAWQMTLERPLLGNGIGSTMVRWVMLHLNTPNYSGCNTHNSILEIGAEFGFPGMIIFIFLAVKMIKTSISFEMTHEEETILFTLMGTGLVSVLIGASYLTSFHFALYCGYYFYLKLKIKYK